MAFIYKVTNDVNGKIYVGKTEYTQPEKRWKEHLQDYKRRKCEKRPFYDAIKKYGPEHFHFEVIEETENPVEREQFWINKLRTYVGFKDCNGYNATLGGEGKKYLNLDEQEVISYHINQADKVVGYTASHFCVDRETIKKILLKNQIDWLSSKQINQRIAMNNKGFVYKIDKETKIIIAKYESVKQAVRNNPNTNNKSIRDASSGVERKDKSKTHMYKDFYWYTDKNLPEEIRKLNNL